jgi:protein-disulfide isomerase
VLVKFNDYMCPPCGQTFAEYKPVLAKYAKEYPGKVKYVTRDYPLDPECNRLAPGGAHMASCEAAVAVRLARDKGKADAMEDWLFANQPTLTTASVKDAARNIGGVTDFDARYGAVLELVKGDIEQGGQLRVQGTPTFFLNGIRLPGLRAEFLDAAIAIELKRAGITVR